MPMKLLPNPTIGDFVKLIIIINLFIILITVWSNIITMAAGQAGQVLLQGDNLEAGQWGGAGLGGDHPPEPRHVPCPHMVILRTHRHQVLLRQSYLGYRRPGQ